jgi:FK506-binding protein 4/5
VLKDEKQNVKAMYRRAQAEYGLKNFEESIRDCKSVVAIDAQNKDARSLLKQAQAGQKEVDKQAKGLFTNMCKALGKGPIPPPGMTKRPYEDMEDEDMGVPGDTEMEGSKVEESADKGEAPAAEAPAAEAPAADVPAAGA